MSASPAVTGLSDGLAGIAADDAERVRLVDDFVRREAARTPLIEPTEQADEFIVTFLYRDPAAQEVLLFVNRLTDERNLAQSLMHRIAGTDLWHLSYRMTGDWRASYSFLPHHPGGRAPWNDEHDQVAIRAGLDAGVADARNPDRTRNRAGTIQSVVALPGAPVQPWLHPRPDTPRGRLTAQAGPGDRTVWIYTPPGEIQADAVLPVLVVFDGDVWTGPQDLPTTLDNLLADGEIPPLIALLPDAGDRSTRWAELDAEGSADLFVTGELLPWARRDLALPITTDPARVIVAGQSLGALSALLTAVRHPDAVGAVLAQSASLWQDGAIDRLTAAVPAGLRAYLEVGRQEWVLRGPNRDLAARLTAAGADVDFVEYNGGHDYACWRGGIADGLRRLTRDWPRSPVPWAWDVRH